VESGTALRQNNKQEYVLDFKGTEIVVDALPNDVIALHGSVGRC
jgi:hypothetical protein